MIDPNIVLGLKPPPNIDPMEIMGKAAQYRNLIAEGQYRQQEADNSRVEGQIKQGQLQDSERARADQATFQEALAAANGDFGAALSQVAGKVDPKYQAAVEKAHYDTVEARSKASQEELKNENAILQTLGGNIEAIMQAPAEARPAAYAEFYQNAAKDPRLGEIAKTHLPINWDDGKMQQLRWQGLAAEKINEQALKLQDQRNKDLAAADAHAEKAATLPAIEAKAVTDKAVAEATVKDPALLTPEQRQQATEKAADAETDAQKFALEQSKFIETKRHNLKEEGLAGARLSADRDASKILTPIEAATLQVPYGTTRAQAAGKMPSTQAQNVVAAYASRMSQSSEEIERLGKELGTGERLYNFLTPNFFNTATGQQFDQAQRDFINAVLRRESGAVISASEFDNAYKQYIPRAGDSPEVLKQKADNRAIQLAAFKRAAGNAYQDPKDILGEVDPAFKAYADKYFGGDIEKAKAHNKK